MERLTNIIFDYGGVIGLTPSSAVATYMFREFGMDQQILQHAITRNTRNLQESHLSETFFWKEVSSGIPVRNINDLKHAWINAIERTSRIDLDSLRLLEDLAKTHKLTLLSNTTQLYVYSPFNTILNKLFSERIYSCDVGLRKPKKGIYDLTLSRLQINPQECIIVDDEQENLTYPSSIGMHTILFKNLPDLEEELKIRLNSGNENK